MSSDLLFPFLLFLARIVRDELKPLTRRVDGVAKGEQLVGRMGSVETRDRNTAVAVRGKAVDQRNVNDMLME